MSGIWLLSQPNLPADDLSGPAAQTARTGRAGDEMLGESGLIRHFALRWRFCYWRRGSAGRGAASGKGTPEVIGREPELAVLAEFLDGGTPWLALLLTGGPGPRRSFRSPGFSTC